MRVKPITKTETSTPIMRLICCFCGVAPTRKPGLRAWDVLPALAEAMHTTPPMLMARAPKAAAVQCRARKTAQVAIKGAMAIPEVGLAEGPMRPPMRDETVTKRKPKITTKTAAATFANRDV